MYKGGGVAPDVPPHIANNRGAPLEEEAEEEGEKEDRVSHACTTFVTTIPGRWRLGSLR